MIEADMKAVRMHAFGPAAGLIYEDVVRPQAGPAEVLVRVQAASVNPVDWKTRIGRGVADNIQALPVILGWDIAGRVVAVGAEVTELQVGDDVYGMVRFPQIGAAYAEYVSAPASELAHKPATLDAIHAAALPLAALTAWQALFEAADLQAGQTVLIHAAAGGVGHLAVQLAKWKGARVIGTASARNAGFLYELGVDQVIDYTTIPFERVLQAVDVVLDNVGGDTLERSFGVVRPGGALISLLADPDLAQASAHGIRATRVIVRPDATQLASLAQLVDAGRIHPVVDTVLPLSAAAAAHELSESLRTRGKIVLQIAE